MLHNINIQIINTKDEKINNFNIHFFLIITFTPTSIGKIPISYCRTLIIIVSQSSAKFFHFPVIIPKESKRYFQKSVITKLLEKILHQIEYYWSQLRVKANVKLLY